MILFQERALLITGGVSVFQDFILVSACNVENETEAIYVFNIADQLDLDTAILLQTNRVLLMSSRCEICALYLFILFLPYHFYYSILYYDFTSTKIISRQDHLLTFDVNSTITIYSLRQRFSMLSKKADLEMECLAEIRVHELLPHPSCVISIQLAQLNYHSDAAEFCPGLDSLLLNISGHLLLLSPVHSAVSNGASKAKDSEENNFQVKYT